MLQLDHSFVAGLGRHDDASKVAEAVIRLAHALGLTVVAEGVERVDQVAQLRALGCEQAQGNLFAPPLTAPDLDAFFASPPPAAPSPTPQMADQREQAPPALPRPGTTDLVPTAPDVETQALVPSVHS